MSSSAEGAGSPDEEADALLISGKDKYKKGEYIEALVDLHAADKLKANCAEILSHMGAAERQLGCSAQALKHLDKADELQAYNSFTMQQRGAVKHDTEDYTGAILDLDFAERLGKGDAVTLSFRGSAKLRAGGHQRVQSAKRDLEKAKQQQPDDALTLACLGVTKSLLGDRAGGFEDLLSAREIHDDRNEIPEPWLLVRLGHAAFAACIRATKDTENPGNLLDCTDEPCAKPKEHLLWQNVVGMLQDADLAQPHNRHILSELGYAKAKAGDPEAGLRVLDEAIRLKDDKHPLQPRSDASHKAEAYYWRACTRLALYDFAGALADLNIADKEAPHTSHILMWRGFALWKLEQAADALEDLTYAGGYHCKSAACYKGCTSFIFGNMGAIKYELGDYRNAEEDLQIALAEIPNGENLTALKYMGATLVHQELQRIGDLSHISSRFKFQEGMRHLQAAHRADAEDPFTLRELGLAHALRGGPEAGNNRLQAHEMSRALELLERSDELERDNLQTLQYRCGVHRALKDPAAKDDAALLQKLEKSRPGCFWLDVLMDNTHGGGLMQQTVQLTQLIIGAKTYTKAISMEQQDHVNLQQTDHRNVSNSKHSAEQNTRHGSQSTIDYSSSHHSSGGQASFFGLFGGNLQSGSTSGAQSIAAVGEASSISNGSQRTYAVGAQCMQAVMKAIHQHESISGGAREEVHQTMNSALVLQAQAKTACRYRVMLHATGGVLGLQWKSIPNRQ